MALGSGRVLALSREIKLGDRVLLYQDVRRKWIAKVEPGRFHTHRGYFELAELVGRAYGGALPISKRPELTPVQPPGHADLRHLRQVHPHYLPIDHRGCPFSCMTPDG